MEDTPVFKQPTSEDKNYRNYSVPFGMADSLEDFGSNDKENWGAGDTGSTKQESIENQV